MPWGYVANPFFPDKRNYALDLLRGLTIALMIVVNNPGDWKTMFTVLRHADWHGFLGADIVFPLFLFIAGYAAALKIQRVYLPLMSSGPHCASALTLEPTETPSFLGPLLRRAALLFLLGLLLNAWPLGLLPGTVIEPANLRLLGVLQRIALCVFFGGVILRYATTRLQTGLAIVVLLVLYEISMRLIVLQTPAGLYGGSFELADNFARFVDTSVLPTAMLYKVKGIPFDPEGLFTTITACATFLLGGLAFRCQGKVRWPFAAVLALLAAALLTVEPLNKNLWTPVYVLFTGTIAVVLLTALEAGCLSPAPRLAAILRPVTQMGQNPLIVYVLSVLVGKTLAVWKLQHGQSVKQVIFSTLTGMAIAPEFLSLAYSLVLLSGMLLLARALRRLPVRL